MQTIMIAIVIVIPTSCLCRHASYKKIGTFCPMENNIYLTQYARSKIECSFVCRNNHIVPCDRFIFKKGISKCLLHSDQPLSSFTKISVETDWDFYGVANNRCKLPRYDYIPHIHSCLKSVRNMTTWVGANEICQNDGGQLVSITSNLKWTFLSNYLNCVSKFWAGLKADHWLSGDPFVNLFGVTVARNNMPDMEYPRDPSYDCGFFTFRFSPEIVYVSCTEKEKQFFVCEIILPL